MPLYRLQYRVETCLTLSQDVSFDHAGHKITFLFSRKHADDRDVAVILEVDGANNIEAQVRASGLVLPPVLDALSFCTRSPLLLGDCKLVLKSQRGQRTRRAIYISKKKVPTPVRLRAQAVGQAQSILDAQGGPPLSLCWQRYALHRMLPLDRFVFQWLALEALAGDVDIVVPCPRCDHERTHKSSSRKRAYELYAAASPETTPKEFREDIWGRARNVVFHGKQYPRPELLRSLQPITDKLRRACDLQFRADYSLDEDSSETQYAEKLYRVFLFVEWETERPDAEYAEDIPETKLGRMVEDVGLGARGANIPDMSGFTLCDYNRDSPNW